MFLVVLDGSAIFGFPKPFFHYAAVDQLFFVTKNGKYGWSKSGPGYNKLLWMVQQVENSTNYFQLKLYWKDKTQGPKSKF